MITDSIQMHMYKPISNLTSRNWFNRSPVCFRCFAVASDAGLEDPVRDSPIFPRYAAANGRTENLRSLFDAGADLDLFDASGETALDVRAGQ